MGKREKRKILDTCRETGVRSRDLNLTQREATSSPRRGGEEGGAGKKLPKKNKRQRSQETEAPDPAVGQGNEAERRRTRASHHHGQGDG